MPLALAAGLVLGGQARPTEPITVSAAVSLTEALQSIATAYERRGRWTGVLQLRRIQRPVAPDRERRSGGRVHQRRHSSNGGRREGGHGCAGEPGQSARQPARHRRASRSRRRGGCRGAGQDATRRGRRSGRRACGRLCEAVPRACRPVEDVATETTSGRERSSGAGGGRKRKRRGRDRRTSPTHVLPGTFV